jgi:hypothetical protein
VLARAAARHLFEEHAASERRAREVQARNDAELERQRARVWGGIRADQIPVGMSAAEAMMASDPDQRPRRKSAVASFLDHEDMILHSYQSAEAS